MHSGSAALGSRRPLPRQPQDLGHPRRAAALAGVGGGRRPAMSVAALGSQIVAELADFQLGSWEARHSLFAHYALYGALLAALGVAAAPFARRAREWWLVALCVASLAIMGSPGLAVLAVLYSLCLYGVVEHVAGRAGTVLSWLL